MVNLDNVLLDYSRALPVANNNRAIQINEPKGFMINSSGNVSFGNFGDYLIIDDVGVKYICSKEYFSSNYIVD